MLLRRYIKGAGVDETLVWYEGSGFTTRRYLVADERGSIAAVTDDAGVSLAANTYDEYGRPGASNMGRFQYTGQAYIPELNLTLVYFHAMELLMVSALAFASEPMAKLTIRSDSARLG